VIKESAPAQPRTGAAPEAVVMLDVNFRPKKRFAVRGVRSIAPYK
jgi:hypothetical protein